MSEIHILASGLGFPEGPVAMADGSVIITEINGGHISRIGADGSRSVLGASAGGPNGIARGPDGALYVCNNGGSHYAPGHFMGQGPSADYAGGYVDRVDAQSGARQRLHESCDGHRLSAPNDLVFDRHGGLYFTDMGKRYARHRDHGGLYYAPPGGGAVRVLAYPMVTPNGVGLSPDEATLYVADTEAARLWAFDIEAPGVIRRAPFPSPHGGRPLAVMPGFCRFDSLAVEASGNIAVTTMLTGAITVFAPDGTPVRSVPMPDTHPTNICFGGADMRTAYITLSRKGELAMMRWAEPGLRLNFQEG